MVKIPTYEDLFGSETEAIDYYLSMFQINPPTTSEIAGTINLSFMKISPIFGQFRAYKVGEDTVRNDHVKRAVCFEANSIITANTGSATIGEGGLNQGDGGLSGNIKSQKIGNITETYGKPSSNGGALGGGGSDLASLLGLLSLDAGVLLVRYLRKTYNMGDVVAHDSGANAF